MRRILDIFRNLRLAWRLLWDGRVPLMLKMTIPIAVSYLAFPFDLIKDFIPVIGRIDDLILFSIAMIIFIRLAPLQVVQEHREAIWGTRVHEGEKITEAEYKILNDDEHDETELEK